MSQAARTTPPEDHRGDGADYCDVLKAFGENSASLDNRRAAEAMATLKPADRKRAKKGKPIMKQLNLRIPERAWELARNVAAEMGLSQPAMIVAAIEALDKANKNKRKKKAKG